MHNIIFSHTISLQSLYPLAYIHYLSSIHQQQTTSTKFMSHQAKSSSVAPPQSSLRSRASAFIPLVTASINKMTTCTTPKNSGKGGGYKPRAAPQCSSSNRRPSSSPTSVVSAHHHTPRNGHYNKGGGGGGGFFVEGASPSPIKKKQCLLL